MTRNLSRGGLFAVTGAEARPGDQVTIEVLHRGIRLKARARVARKTDEGLGLSFEAADEAFRGAIRALMDELVIGQAAPEGFDDVKDGAELRLSWSPPTGGSWWRFWQKRRHVTEVVNLNLDGAGLRSEIRPEVADTIIIFLEGRKDGQGNLLACEAEVVRHTGGGFAVRFLSPSIEFRRAVSAARRSKFG
jgi:hypothetical protein